MTNENKVLEETEQKGLSVKTVKRIAFIAVFTAMSAVGALIKIPSPVGTIGLDSAAGFFCAAAFGYPVGISVIFLGHLLTSGLVGFPLGIPIHLFIAAQMVAWACVYRWTLNKWGIIAASIAAVILNGVVSSFTMMFMGGIGAVMGVMPFLAVGSAINIALSSAAWKILKRTGLLN